MKRGMANVIIDGQWGSCGKGKLAALLASRFNVDVAVIAAQPQAGHTWVNDAGEKRVCYHLPVSGVVNPKCVMLLSAGSTIDPEKFLKEVDEHKCHNRVYIHPHAAVVTAEDKALEADVLKDIASTAQGVGSAAARKVMRRAKVARDFSELAPFIMNFPPMEILILTSLEKMKMVLVESTQGFGLSLDFGFYPHVTSRNITVSAILAASGIPPRLCGDVYGVVRTFPIRVGNAEGFSGGCWSDQRETTWEEITQSSGSKEQIIETTTVTKRVRRVFTFSLEQLYFFLRVNEPTHLFINFINYINALDAGAREYDDLSPKSSVWLNRVMNYILERKAHAQLRYTPGIRFLGTGAKDSEVITCY